MLSKRELFAAIAISYVGLAEWSSTWWPKISPCVVNPHDYAEYYARQDQCPAFHFLLIKTGAGILEIFGDHDWVIAIGTAIIALFTFILAAVGWTQGRLAQHTLDLARKEFLSAHRPQIRIKHLWLANDIWGENQPIVVNLTCVNAGTSEAIL